MTVPDHIDFDAIPSPCYVLDEAAFLKNLRILKEVEEASGATIICALKGFAMYSVFDRMREYLATCAASSKNEARLCFEEMGRKAHVCGPAYPHEEFEEMLQYSSHITFNSLNQWKQFKAKVAEYPEPVSCGIRINPEYSEVDTEIYNPCAPGSRLGITADELGDQLPEGIEGIHFHSLCENDAETLERTLAEVEKRFGHLLQQVRWVNMGGGHHITREDYDRELLVKIIREFRKKYDVEVILEPGEAVGWYAGYLRSSVLDILNSKGINVTVLDVSFTAHMPDCLEMPFKPGILGATEPVEGKPTYRMGGLTCLAGDQMGDYSFGRELNIGDTLVFEDQIYYTTVKTTTFNGVNLPSIGIWRENGEFELVKTFGYEDYKRRL